MTKCRAARRTAVTTHGAYEIGRIFSARLYFAQGVRQILHVDAGNFWNLSETRAKSIAAM